MLGSAAEAEDCTQEALIKAYAALPRFRTAAPFRPWLLQIVANEARNRRRASGRRQHLILRAAQTVHTEDEGPSPEELTLAAAERETLLAALNQLRDDERQIIAYRYFLELHEAEMAQILGCRRGTVKSRLSRALRQLRTVLQHQPSGATTAPSRGRHE